MGRDARRRAAAASDARRAPGSTARWRRSGISPTSRRRISPGTPRVSRKLRARRRTELGATQSWCAGRVSCTRSAGSRYPSRIWQKTRDVRPQTTGSGCGPHTYHAERVLCRSPFLADLVPAALSRITQLAHGSGYHRGAVRLRAEPGRPRAGRRRRVLRDDPAAPHTVLRWCWDQAVSLLAEEAERRPARPRGGEPRSPEAAGEHASADAAPRRADRAGRSTSSGCWRAGFRRSRSRPGSASHPRPRTATCRTCTPRSACPAASCGRRCSRWSTAWCRRREENSRLP